MRAALVGVGAGGWVCTRLAGAPCPRRWCVQAREGCGPGQAGNQCAATETVSQVHGEVLPDLHFVSFVM